MRETEIYLLDKKKVPAAALFKKLLALKPNLTVDYLCKRSKKPVPNVWIALISFTENGDIHLEELLK